MPDRSAFAAATSRTRAGPVAAPTREPRQGLDPQVVLTLKDLELRARVVMEGLRSGLHRSPFTGFSVEFTEYRPYSPGDDLRYLDWRVLARSDRHVLRKYEEETNLRCQLVLDVSRSMSFGSRAGVTKMDYAKSLVAALAWFLHEQRDVVGLALFEEGLRHVIPPRWRPGHLQHILAALARASGERRTELALALQQVARLNRRRSLIILVSDFLEPVHEWTGALGELCARGHDVRAWQVLDPAEVALEEFGRAALWEDLENGATRFVDPAQARAAYEMRFSAHDRDVQQVFQRHGVAHQRVLTKEPLDLALLRFLRGAQPPRFQRRTNQR